MTKLYVIGAGPGGKSYILPRALEVVHAVPTLVCTSRLQNLFNDAGGLVVTHSFQEMIDAVDDALGRGDTGVVVSGNPSFHSMLTYLKKRYPHIEIETIPAIGSLDYLLAKASICSDDVIRLSCHGKGDAFEQALSAVKKHRYTALLLDEEINPATVSKAVIDVGLNNCTVWAGENLSYPDERIECGTPEEIADKSWGALCVMIIENPNPAKEKNKDNFGLAEDFWIRKPHVPMTKAEVRTVVLSKLKLSDAHVVWDLGAGSGSVGIEVLRLSDTAFVYAVERKKNAQELILENAERFNVDDRLQVVPLDIADALETLPKPTHVFIGGSGGTLKEALDKVSSFGSGIRVVITAATLKTAGESERLLRTEKFRDVEMVMLQVSRSRELGESVLFNAENPVIIHSATTS